MESTNIEKKRFESKSKGYSNALKLVPYARTFEVIPILSILNDFINKSGLTKNSVRIVELMAGSGFLTKHLIENGYKNIDVFEISPDMSKNIVIDSKKYKNIHIHSIENILDIDEQLSNIKPHIVISLAGYHHLIDYDQNMKVDINKSIAFQKKVTDLSIAHVAEHHLIFIIDIFDDNLSAIQRIPNYWKMNKRINKLIPAKLIPSNIISSIYKTKNIRDYSKILEKNFINSTSGKNNAIKWFRNVIDKHTSVGHKDIAIRKEFINMLDKDYKVSYSTVSTPWIFKNMEQLKEYIKVFWFLEYNDDKNKLKEIFDLINQMNISKSIENGTTFFNWELAYVTVQKKGINIKDNITNKLLMYLFVLVGVLVVGILIKSFTFNYKLTSLFDKLIFTNYILIFKDVVIPKIKTLLLA